MQVTKEIKFEAAHRLRHHLGACSNLHGHSYRLQVTLEGEIQRSGMVVDFGDVSRILKEIVDEGKWSGADEEVPWDHSVILNIDDPLLKGVAQHTGRVIVLPCEPTAEMMVDMFASMIQGALDHEGKHHCRVRRVRLWETEKSCAEWDVYDEVNR